MSLVKQRRTKAWTFEGERARAGEGVEIKLKTSNLLLKIEMFCQIERQRVNVTRKRKLMDVKAQHLRLAMRFVNKSIESGRKKQ